MDFAGARPSRHLHLHRRGAGRGLHTGRGRGRGRSSGATDWWGRTDGGFWPDWETFHIGQLLPWIDANFNTIEDRSGRAIAGPSKAYRVEQVFGPYSNFPTFNPWDLAASYGAYDGKLVLYSGGLPDGETGIGGFNVELHNRLNEPAIDVEHRWCVGNGGHDWAFWQKDLTDFLAFVYSDEPLTCHYATTPETPT